MSFSTKCDTIKKKWKNELQVFYYTNFRQVNDASNGRCIWKIVVACILSASFLYIEFRHFHLIICTVIFRKL